MLFLFFTGPVLGSSADCTSILGFNRSHLVQTINVFCVFTGPISGSGTYSTLCCVIPGEIVLHFLQIPVQTLVQTPPLF